MTSMVIFVVAARANLDYFIHAKLIEFIAAGKGFDAFFFSLAFHLRHTAIHIIGRVIVVIAFVMTLMAIVFVTALIAVIFVAALVTVIFVIVFIIIVVITFTALIVPLGIIHLLISHLRNSSL
jgi:hypothetical protein